MSSSPRKKGRSPFFYLLPCLILLIIALFIYIKPDKPAIQETQLHDIQTPEEESIVTTSFQEEKPVPAPPEQTAPPEAISPAPLQEEVQITNDTQTGVCEDGSTAVSLFLSHLSEQEYVKAYELNEDLAGYLNKIVIKLLNNPPEITDEANDLLSILKNAAHFYRVLGPKDISLLKDILIFEGEGLESMLTDLYNWSQISDECQNDEIRFSMPLKKSYEYSCFFLNTLGGQSYLFRRESRTRILIKYYSLLILNAADRQNLNKYNYNITDNLQTTIDDLKEAHFLINKNLYVANLVQIQERLSAVK